MAKSDDEFLVEILAVVLLGVTGLLAIVLPLAQEEPLAVSNVIIAIVAIGGVAAVVFANPLAEMMQNRADRRSHSSARSVSKIAGGETLYDRVFHWFKDRTVIVLTAVVVFVVLVIGEIVRAIRSLVNIF